MDIEAGLISKALEQQDLVPILSAKIKLDHFVDDEHRMVFGWMLEYLDKYGDSPTIKALKAEFPQYKTVRCVEPYQFYIDQKVEQNQRNILIETFDELAGHLKGFNNDEAIKALGFGTQRYYENDGTATSQDFVETVEERLDYYDLLTEHAGELIGIPTGFPSLDKITSGLQPEQLWFLVGLPKAGKSYLLLHMAQTAQDVGKKVLFISFEMSAREIGMRYDAMRAGINFLDLQGGNLSATSWKQLEERLEAVKAMSPFIVEHDPSSVTTTSLIGARIRETQPDLVFVDGVYMMDPEGPHLQKETPQGLTSVTRSLKRLSQREKLPIVGTTQALISKYSKARGVQQDTIGYTGSFLQDADGVLSGEKTEEEHILLMKVLAARNAPTTEFYLRQDWTTTSIVEHDMDEYDWSGIGDDHD